MKKLIVGLCCALLPTAAFAQQAANHLVITEVGYDTTDETGTTAEYVEIYNPTNTDVVLNAGAVPGTAGAGGSYFLSDVNSTTTAGVGYWSVVNGNVNVGGVQDFVVQFPVGATIPAHGTVVVAMHSADFLTEFYGGSLATFQALPGKPQLFEIFQDGSADGVPDMIPRFTTTATVQGFTNGGEPAILYYWDGTSDLVKDVDIVVWGATNQVPNKSTTGVPISIDGPDSDTLPSTYLPETSSTAVFLGSAANINSVQRAHIVETESATTGNGITGHSEVNEDWTTLVLAPHTPGLPLIRLNSAVDDAISFLPVAGVSPADGPGSGATNDFGSDGTVTEVYASIVDTDQNRVPDALYFALRGSFFETAADKNASFILVDLNPQQGQVGGVKTLVSNGNQLGDVIGNLDNRITAAGFALDGGYTGSGFDLAVGADSTDTATADNAGARGFGSGGVIGTTNDFAWLTGASVGFDNVVRAQLPGAPGTSYAAENGLEMSIPLSQFSSAPTYIYVVAVTTSDTGSPSPNTVPESTGNTFATPHILDNGACIELATGRIVRRYVDLDGDGVGGSTPYCGPLTTNTSDSTGDCDDNDIARAPGKAEVCDNKDNDCNGTADDGLVTATYYRDLDADTFGSPSSTQTSCAQPTGYVTNNTDCNDNAAGINPLAQEVCDAANVDEDCDATADDLDSSTTGKTTYYRDSDNDTFGTLTATAQSCEAAPTGYVTDSTDCDDSDPAVKPGATEVCDGKDNNCAGGIDEGVSTTTFRDSDNDTFGDPNVTQPACAATPPPGYVLNGNDCNDSNAAVKPGATEIPGDGVDQNCDAVEVCFADADNDGYRPNGTATVSSVDADCADANEAGSSDPVGDCNDNAATINPGATEVPGDNIDQNCNGAEVCYADMDDDGYRPNTTSTVNSADLDCADATEATGTDPATDCDDTNSAVNPGATEVAGNNVDENCDATVVCYADADNDGYRPNSTATTSSSDGDCDDAAEARDTDPVGDCNDTVATVNPGATEVCDASNVDEDCDAAADDADSAATGKTAFYTDADSDTFGGGSAIMRCDAAPGQVTNNTDCNDSNANVKPGAPEVCNNVDDDCDGTPDDNATDATAFYRDADSDTYGSLTVTQMACTAPTGYVANSNDCDDTAATIHPGATETCNMADDDCDTTVDEGVKTTFYADGDADGVGGTTTQDACAAPTGYVSTTGDCDDADLTVKPGATETCDTKDNNCDGTIDEGVKTTFYVDADNDGAGGSGTQDACTAPTGYVASNNDCDDTDAARKPAGTEVCDGKDNNCNGTVDEGVQTTFYTDADGDGQGGQSSVSACTAPAGTATNSDDCNDGNANVKKADKEEVCNDALDNDCDGKVDGDDSDDCQAEQIAPESACGCSSGSSAMFAPALLMALAFIGRRRRNA